MPITATCKFETSTLLAAAGATPGCTGNLVLSLQLFWASYMYLRGGRDYAHRFIAQAASIEAKSGTGGR